jgi:hypothetical protein
VLVLILGDQFAGGSAAGGAQGGSVCLVSDQRNLFLELPRSTEFFSGNR